MVGDSFSVRLQAKSSACGECVWCPSRMSCCFGTHMSSDTQENIYSLTGRAQQILVYPVLGTMSGGCKCVYAYAIQCVVFPPHSHRNVDTENQRNKCVKITHIISVRRTSIRWVVVCVCMEEHIISIIIMQLHTSRITHTYRHADTTGWKGDGGSVVLTHIVITK